MAVKETFEMKVYRIVSIEDGSTKVETYVHGTPLSWEMRHKMLIDALSEVKREAGITHGKPYWEEQ